MGGIPLPCEAIEAHHPENPEKFYGYAVQIRKRGKSHAIADLVRQTKAELKEDESRYLELVQSGHAALENNRWDHDLRLELACALSIKHAHITYNKGLLRFLNSKLKPHLV